MYEDMRVKYLFINMRYGAYIVMQATLVAVALIGAALCGLYAGDSRIWVLKNGWWIFLLVAVVETVEAVIAIGKAKREYNQAKPPEVPPMV